jgi:hypothetical protein
MTPPHQHLLRDNRLNWVWAGREIASQRMIRFSGDHPPRRMISIGNQSMNLTEPLLVRFIC